MIISLTIQAIENIFNSMYTGNTQIIPVTLGRRTR